MDNDRLILLFGRGLSAATLSGYHRAYSGFVEWLDGRPESDETIALYLEHLQQAGLAPPTGAMLIAAVNASCREDGSPSPIGRQAQGALRTWRKESAGRGRGQAPSISWETADLAISIAEGKGDLRGLRDAALLGVMSDCLLRGSEAANLLARDFTLTDDASGRIVVQRGKGQLESSAPLFVGPATASRVIAWQYAGQVFSGPLFRRIRRGGKSVGDDALTRQSVSRIIQTRIAATGIKVKASSHSLRIGSAGSLASRGATVPELQQAGRWKSPAMPAHYAASELAARSAVARLRYGVVSTRR